MAYVILFFILKEVSLLFFLTGMPVVLFRAKSLANIDLWAKPGDTGHADRYCRRKYCVERTAATFFITFDESCSTCAPRLTSRIPSPGLRYRLRALKFKLNLKREIFCKRYKLGLIVVYKPIGNSLQLFSVLLLQRARVTFSNVRQD